MHTDLALINQISGPGVRGTLSWKFGSTSVMNGRHNVLKTLQIIICGQILLLNANEDNLSAVRGLLDHPYVNNWYLGILNFSSH